MARPRLSVEVKAARGTLRPHRERGRPRRQRVEKAPKPRDFVHIADRYAADILAGRIVACEWVKKAVTRFQRMRARAAVGGAYTWSSAHANDVCSFVERSPHVEGSWKSGTITLQPWQIFVLCACYGFRQGPDDRRLVTTVFFEVARKSAKSTIVAALGLYHLVIEQEPGGQVVCGASTGQQARIVFGIMQKMVRRSLWLREQGLRVFANAITHESSGGTAKPINSKSSSQDGLNPSYVSLDESHAQDFQLHDVLKSAQGARTNPMLIAPTTAGFDLTSVGFALRSGAMKILDGVVDSDHTFAVLYELDPDDDWRDATTWIKSAPMIGVTPSIEYVQRYCADAQTTPGMQGEFETKICNRWLHSARAWLSMTAWDACADATITFDAFRGQPAWIGVDLAERDDIAAVAIAVHRDGLIYLFVRGYLPELVVAERARAVPEYRAWVRSGELITTPGNLTDYSVIETDIRQLCKTVDVKAIVLERYGALNMAANLSATGLPASIESKNPKTFTAPCKELEARLKARKLRHTGSTFLKWQASNVCVERRRDGSLLPTKERAESPNKIDAIDAVLLAMGAMISEPAVTVEPTYQMLIFGR